MNTIQKKQTAEREHFTRMTRQIERLILSRQPERIIAASRLFLDTYEHSGRALLALGLNAYIAGQPNKAIEFFNKASSELEWNDYPEPHSVYSQAYIQAQLNSVNMRERARQQARDNYLANLESLFEIAPELAEKLETEVLSGQYCFLGYWGGLHLHENQNNSLLILDREIKERLIGPLTQRGQVRPIGIFGLNHGRELPFCLQYRRDFLYGWTVPVYLFMPDLSDLRIQLCLGNYQEAIKEQTLLIFAGETIRDQVARSFRSLRYGMPDIIIGDQAKLLEYFKGLITIKESENIQDRVISYYRSAEFRQRQLDIAAGRIKPRVMIETSRWTTFLKYCADDFRRAFEQLGCQTCFLIEENDIQRISNCLQIRQMDEFRPDVYFMVSFARTAMSEMFPRELPFIAYLQDRCDKLWQMEDRSIRRLFSPQDLLVCLVKEYQDYLTDKQVPDWQTMIMPVPVDPEMFYPVPSTHPLAARLSCEVSYVKHGGGDTDKIMENWIRENHLDGTMENLKPLGDYFWQWFNLFRNEPQRHWAERIFHEEVDQNFGRRLDEKQLNVLHQMVTQFATVVYTACRRRYYLEGFIDAGLDLRLYGHGWQDDRIFGKFSGGIIDRSQDLLGVYNFSKINLHMQPYITMHQRVVECALSGGFMMIADIPQEDDWGKARDYFDENHEVVFFGSSADMIDKCRYYLEHESHRREMAERFRQRALANHTVLKAADHILARWRQILNASLRGG